MSHIRRTGQNTGLSRRSFIAGAAGLSAAAAFGLAGCSAPKNAAEKPNEITSSQSDTMPDWLGQAPEIKDSDISNTQETDLLIIGAGNGGMAAAAYAAANGIDFQICEVSDAVGATRHWFAAIDTPPFTSQGITVDRQRLLGEIVRYSSGMCNQRLIKMWMDESADVFAFVDPIMSASGAKVVADEYEMPGGMGGTPFYTPPMEHHYVAADGSQKVAARNDLFEKFINSKDKHVLYKYEVVKLVREDNGTGHVSGAIFKTDNGYAKINARKAVLLTTGGYSANSDMLTALSPVTVKCVTALGYNQNNRGGGQKAAMQAGAVRDLASATMIFDRGIIEPGTTAGYTQESIKAGNPQWPTEGQFNPGTQPFLKVNMKGERFADESADYDYLPHAAAMQPGGVYCSIWDGNFAADVTRFHTLGCSAMTRNSLPMILGEGGTFDQEIKKGTLQKADTLEELADKLKLPKDTFLKTVARYNELYDKQTDDDFHKEAYRLSSLRTPPYYGAPLGGTLLTTLDGIRIDENCRALGEDHEPIEGLYCAGDCSGSVFSGNYPDQLHGFACGRTMTEAIHVVKLVKSM